MGADDALPGTARATNIDLAEAVDEEIVADIVPAETLRVVGVGAAHESRSIGLRVGVPPGGVMNEGHLDRGEVRVGLAQRLVGSPARARHQRRLSDSSPGGLRELQSGDRGRSLAQRRDGLLASGAAALRVESHEAYPGQLHGRVACDCTGAQLYSACRPGPKRFGECARCVGRVCRPLERSFVPLAPRLAVGTGAQTHDQLTLCLRHVAEHTEHREAQAGIEGGKSG